MSEREYIKFNTSIQVSSNSGGLQTDSEGNVAAILELRLPDNIFPAENGNKKVDSVQMLTTKMRISMENTPIAQLPLDMDLLTNTFTPSTCQLGVYPYCLLDDQSVKPLNIEDSAFPYYYDITSGIYVYVRHANETEEQIFVEFPSNSSDDTGLSPFNRDLKNILKEIGYWKKYCAHPMNLCAQSNHETFLIENNSLLVKHISTLEQMMQDALENAVTFASTQSKKYAAEIYVLEVGAEPTEQFTPMNDTKYQLGNMEVYLCNYIPITGETAHYAEQCHLKTAFKPIVKFTEQSMRIEYDTGCFDNIIPVIWQPAYVQTWDVPEQLTEDSGRYWSTVRMPPLKRVYKYNMNIDNQTGLYSFSLLPSYFARAFNIVGNEEMYRTFSFLPWIKLTPNSNTPMQGGRIPETHLVTSAVDEPVYILDGTGATVTMSDPEPILDNSAGYNVTRNTRIWYNSETAVTPYATGVSTGTVKAPWYCFYSIANYDDPNSIKAGMFNEWLNSLVNADIMSSACAIDMQNLAVSQNNYQGVFIFGSVDKGTDASHTPFNGRLYFNVLYPPSEAVSRQQTTKQSFAIAPPTTDHQENVTESQYSSSEHTTNPDAPSWAGETTTTLTPRTTTTRTDGGTLVPQNTVYFFARTRPDSDFTFVGNDVPAVEDFRWTACDKAVFGEKDTIHNKFPYRIWGEAPDNMNGAYFDEVKQRTFFWFEIEAAYISNDPTSDYYTDVYNYLESPPENNQVMAFAVTWDQAQTPANGGIYRCNESVETRDRKETVVTTVETLPPVYTCGNVHLTFEWNNLPIVVLSPIQSIVLTLQGMNVNQEYQPINVAQPGGSSLVSTIPVIENYYSLAQTLRDLHDELVVIKESYDDQPCYSLSTVDGQARSLRLAAHYITKDGRLHQIYIPPNGVFSLQLTFGISFYFTS